MKYLTFLSLFFLASCAHEKIDNSNVEKERSLYNSWVLSRCFSEIAKTEVEKQDALNSASAYLELSALPVDAFTDSFPLITKFISRDYTGSVKGSFNTKKCIDLFYSKELKELFYSNYLKYK